MATMTLTIPDAVAPRVVDALAGRYGYSAQIADSANPGQYIPNPETKNQFAKRMLAAMLRDTVIEYEAFQARTAAATTASTDISIT